MLFDFTHILYIALAVTGVSAGVTSSQASRRGCSTNAECLKRGLPLRAPTKRALARSMHRIEQRAPDIATFDYTGAVQTYTIPADDNYFISVQGGSGGDNKLDFTAPGGTAAQVNGTVTLASGTVLNIVVGGQAKTVTTTYGGGGGGGSFVYDTNNNLLAAAGGGGGGKVVGDAAYYGGNANSDFSTTAGDGSGLDGGSGGSNGQQGTTTPQAGAGGPGAGFLSGGTYPQYSGSGYGGFSKPNWIGGYAQSDSNANGAFGGGGAGGYSPSGNSGAGGGGGYSGGGSGGDSQGSGAGGGGANYFTPSGSDASATASKIGNGVIIITKLNNFQGFP
ncbi:uncharacterized protein L201_006420 [Kwoniella dendrophila CBS 6074]|uniref:Uncharacterized protein n=1 Tax=Kwoniella dendrophila CBS 6074 TaxID=1295534 RepID=A0AAX4K2S3_9TREE